MLSLSPNVLLPPRFASCARFVHWYVFVSRLLPECHYLVCCYVPVSLLGCWMNFFHSSLGPAVFLFEIFLKVGHFCLLSVVSLGGWDLYQFNAFRAVVQSHHVVVGPCEVAMVYCPLADH